MRLHAFEVVEAVLVHGGSIDDLDVLLGAVAVLVGVEFPRGQRLAGGLGQALVVGRHLADLLEADLFKEGTLHCS